MFCEGQKVWVTCEFIPGTHFPVPSRSGMVQKVVNTDCQVILDDGHCWWFGFSDLQGEHQPMNPDMSLEEIELAQAIFERMR